MAWKKGQSGNPHGRPRKGNTATEILEEIGQIRTQVRIGKSVQTVPRFRALFFKLYDLALNQGDTAAAKLILEYQIGRPAQQLEIGGYDGEPILVQFPKGFLNDDTTDE